MTKEALKLALEALTIQSDRVTEIGKQREAITAIKKALAQPEQGPVYLIWSEDMEGWIHGDKKQYDLMPEEERWLLYTTPPKREWVKLTDEEITKHFQENVDTGSLLSFVDGVRFAEAKSKEKNT